MNLTRWSARLPGGQRRAAPPAEPGTTPSVPAARELPDQPPEPAVRHEHADHEHLPVRDVLSHLPALVAVSYGPSHRMAYLSRAWTEVFGHRPIGIPAAKVLPELRELGLLPLMDQVYRTGRARTVKARKVPHTSSASANGSARYYTFVCAPVRETEDLGEQLAALTSAGNTPAHGTRVLGGLGAFTSLRRSTGASDVCGVLVFGAEVTDQVQVTESLRESERRHREAAVTLQRSLLPQKLEQPDDLRVAATYQPGGADAAVGGDWYDVITLGGGRTALVIGDVMGRGMRAAAVMGQLRTAVRAYARLDLPRTRCCNCWTAWPRRSTRHRSPPASTPSSTRANSASPTPRPATCR